MSGGHFDYQQYRINTIADEILDEIRKNEEGYEDYPDGVSYGYGENGTIKERPEGWQRYSGETLKEFKEGARLCKLAAAYAQRIDWLISGDDSESCFHKRLEEDIEKIRLEIKQLDENNWNIGKKREDVEGY